ncbi:MAG: HAMP domain-containing histidine kinase [Candidatus Eisenbacteria bacterium]|uniref:histidine kinase n=1 Tax=Eiseniibacteriota bacterium TaxID=2212470 RepID=A0A956NJU0_UNCEI|nr:HAMP domain-containing histidine kinase [Candidatus Eisenbacteria bacterium]
MSTSLKARLTLTVQVALALTLVTFVLLSLGLTHHFLRTQESGQLISEAKRAASHLELEYEEDPNLARAAATMMAEEPAAECRIDIFDAAGALLASSEPASARAGQSLEEALADSERSQRSTPAIGGRATVVASKPVGPRRTALVAIATSLLLTGAALFAIVWVIAGRSVGSSLRPLAELANAAERASIEAARPALHQQTGLTELDQLIGSLDRLLARIEQGREAERRFVAEASHELRTPLTNISGELELLLGAPEPDDPTREALARIADQTATLRDLVEALLLLRRAEEVDLKAEGVCEPVNLGDVVRDLTAQLLRRTPSRTPDVAVKAPDELLVLGEPQLVSIAVRNLMDNALKFSPVGVSVSVEVRREGDFGEVLVEDGGAGITPGEETRVFEPFYRGRRHSSEPGSGLGLAIVERIVRAHAGEVSADGSSLGGARFRLRLPLL